MSASAHVSILNTSWIAQGRRRRISASGIASGG